MSEPSSVAIARALHEAIERELDAREQEHRNEYAQHLVTGTRGQLNILAAGDSWFDYPIGSDLIKELKKIIQPRPMINSLAHWGYATTDMLGVPQWKRLVKNLEDKTHGPLDAILFSGGGNDIAGAQFRLWLEDCAAVRGDASKAIKRSSFDAVMGVVLAAYNDLIATRDACGLQKVPIFTYSYDLAYPSGQGVCFLGPWLAPSLQARQWMKDTPDASDIATGAEVVKLAMVEFDQMLQGLARFTRNNVVHVSTQGILKQDIHDWANELHPTNGGFTKIARRIASAIAHHFVSSGARASV